MSSGTVAPEGEKNVSKYKTNACALSSRRVAVSVKEEEKLRDCGVRVPRGRS